MAQGLLSVYHRFFIKMNENEDINSSDLSSEETKRNNNEKPLKHDKKSPKNKAKLWVVKITIITFLLSALFSLLSGFATERSNLIVVIFTVLLLIIISILFDGIAVSVTACDPAPLLAMAARKVPGSKAALFLVKNAEKVNSICADVVGDICGIVSGACSVVIVARIIEIAGTNQYEFWITILISSVLAALTVGGKALEKYFAMKYSKEFVLATAKILKLFVKEKNL